jgi:hypothetical protein
MKLRGVEFSTGTTGNFQLELTIKNTITPNPRLIVIALPLIEAHLPRFSSRLIV